MERGYQLLWRVGLAVRLREFIGGMVRVRAVKQEILECRVKEGLKGCGQWISR
jgi:hypothetical protein